MIEDQEKTKCAKCCAPQDPQHVPWAEVAPNPQTSLIPCHPRAAVIPLRSSTNYLAVSSLAVTLLVMFSYFCTWHLGQAVGAFSEHGLGWWPQHTVRVLCCFSGGLSDWRWQWREVRATDPQCVTALRQEAPVREPAAHHMLLYRLTHTSQHIGETCTCLMFTFVHLVNLC